MATNTAVEVVMPQMGVSVSEGTITKWSKQVGDTVEADETLLEISTDKVDTEVPSPASGIVSEILVQEGETVEVGTVLARIGGEAGSAAPAAPPAAPRPSPLPHRLPRLPPRPQRPLPHRSPLRRRRAVGERPLVRLAGRRPDRRRARHRPDAGARHRRWRPRHEEGHPGLHRVGAAGSRRAEPAPAPAPQAETPAPPAPPPVAPPRRRPLWQRRHRARPAAGAASQEPQAAGSGENFEPMSAMRRGIAEHMRKSLDTSAHVTSAIEVDMSKVVAIREKLKKEYTAAYGVNPTYLAFIARATTETLRDYPYVNGEIRGDKIVTKNFVNLGFAVELADGKGLIVPVVKNAETLNLLGMAKGIADIAKRARDKKLTPDDVAGGSFTITNPGGYGTFHGTPVI